MITASCEGVRLDLQLRLDQAKTALERNKLGQFATPTALAHDILERAHHYLPEDAPVTFLDPAFGTGSFYSALLHVFAGRKITTATGYEIDPHYGDEALKLWSNTPLQLHIADFTQAEPPLLILAAMRNSGCNSWLSSVRGFGSAGFRGSTATSSAWPTHGCNAVGSPYG
jgi:hypothetical protein